MEEDGELVCLVGVNDCVLQRRRDTAGDGGGVGLL
jgi:hypothetical protein